MKRLIYTLVFFVLSTVLLSAQGVQEIVMQDVCWNAPTGQDSSLVRYILLSSRKSHKVKILGHLNASGAYVNTQGGSFSSGNCCCKGNNGGGGGNDDDWRFIGSGTTVNHDIFTNGRVGINTQANTHGLRVDSTFQFNLEGGTSVFDWQDGTGVLPYKGLMFQSDTTGQFGESNISLTMRYNGFPSVRSNLGIYFFGADNFYGNHKNTAYIRAHTQGQWSNQNNGTNISFHVTPEGDTVQIKAVEMRHDGRINLPRYNNFYDPLPVSLHILAHQGNQVVSRHEIEGTHSAGKVIGVNDAGDGLAWVYPSLGKGNIAYLNDAGEDSSGELGNIFRPYKTLDKVYVDNSTDDVLIIDIDAKEYKLNSGSFTNKNLTINTKLGTNIYNTKSTPFIIGGDLTVLGKPNLYLDTSYVNNEFIRNISTEPPVDILLDLNNVYANRPHDFSGYGRQTFTDYYDNIRTLRIGANNIEFNGSSLAFLSQIETLEANISNITYTNSHTGNSTLAEGAFITRSSLNNGLIDIKVSRYINKSTGRYLKGLFNMNGLNNSNLLAKNNIINIECDYFESNKVLPDRTQSSPHSFFEGDIDFSAGHDNSNITIYYKQVKKSALLNSSSNSGRTGLDLKSSTFVYKIDNADVKHRLINTPNHSEFVDTSSFTLSCANCDIYENSAIYSTAIIDTSSRFNITNSNIKVHREGYPIAFVSHDLYISETQFFNDGIHPLIEAPSGTTITVYSCNTNLTQDRMGSGVTLVHCDGQGLAASSPHYEPNSRRFIPASQLNAADINSPTDQEIRSFLQTNNETDKHWFYNGLDIDGKSFMTGYVDKNGNLVVHERPEGKIKARFDFSLADLKTINTTYTLRTGDNGAYTVFPFMSTVYHRGGGTFTPATNTTFINTTTISTQNESVYIFPKDADCMIRFKTPNFTDNSVDNANQGIPLPCLIVNGAIVKIDASSTYKDTAISEFYYSFNQNDKIQIGFISGNIDSSDEIDVVDLINESDADLLLEDQHINVSWFSIEEF